MPTQFLPIFNSTDPGISFDDNPQTWTINPNVIVSSTDNDGVYSALANSTLDNFGMISGDDSGVHFIGINGLIDNFAGGSISGAGAGVIVAGSANIINADSIAGNGTYGIWASGPSDQVYIHNTGSITGKLAGIRAGSDHEGGTILNDGLITGKYGIDVYTAAGDMTLITNQAQGIIKSDSSSLSDGAIHSHLGGIHLVNSGRVLGVIELEAVGQRDEIINYGKIQREVFLGSGNDLFKGLSGTSGTVWGEAGNDRLIGSTHTDRLLGGSGKDTLTGGRGADLFIYDLPSDSPVGVGHDLITDFNHAQHDRIDTSGSDLWDFIGRHAFTGAGELRYVLQDHAGTANDRTMIFGNLDADRAPEFQIEVKGLVHFVEADFLT